MLFLTRKVNQKILIGDVIIITVVSIKGNFVKLGFNAPRGIKINREEVYERIIKEGIKL